jgi:threonine synthase
MEAMRDLGREGIGAEPSSAAGVAAMKQAVKAGRVRSDDTVVCVITGTAFKQPDVVRRVAAMPEKTVRADVDSLEKLLEYFHMDDGRKTR